MNKEDFANYMLNNSRKLWPDSIYTPGKPVLVLVDGGPGCTNTTMLALLRVLGIYLFHSGFSKYNRCTATHGPTIWIVPKYFFPNLQVLWEERVQLARDKK